MSHHLLIAGNSAKIITVLSMFAKQVTSGAPSYPRCLGSVNSGYSSTLSGSGHPSGVISTKFSG